MRALALAVVFAFAFVLPGCAHAPTEVQRCQASDALLFREDASVEDRSVPTLSAQSFAILHNTGVWIRANFTISATNGTDAWTPASAGALHNVTIQDVKFEFEKGITHGDRDVNVSYAVRRTLSSDEYAAICGMLVHALRAIPATDRPDSCTTDSTARYQMRLDGLEWDRAVICGGTSAAARDFAAVVSDIKANDTLAS